MSPLTWDSDSRWPDRYEAGLGGGQRMAEAGVTTRSVSIRKSATPHSTFVVRASPMLWPRREARSRWSQVNLADPTGAQPRIEAALTSGSPNRRHSDPGPDRRTPAIAALTDSDQLGQINLATFDLSPEVLDAFREWRHALRYRLSSSICRVTCRWCC